MSWWSSLFGGRSKRKQESAIPDLSDIEDDLYPRAVTMVMESGNCSVSFVQRALNVGFIRASRLIDAMEKDRIISHLDGEGSRRVLSDRERGDVQQDQSLASNCQRPDADDPFDREFYFVPYPRITTPHADLLLAGTKCYLDDPVFAELATRNGRWVPSNKCGQISDFFTHTDIGQLDFAINDYIEFLVRIRSVAESELPENTKEEMIKAIAKLTGPDGHSHSAFIDAHGGIDRLIAKLI